MAESDEWPQRVLQDLARQDLLERFASRMQQGVVLSTDYSGVGAAEEAVRCLRVALNRLFPDEAPSMVVYQRCGDKEPSCRSVLRSHVLTGPSCVHGDIGERCDREIWEAMSMDIARIQNSEVLRTDIDPGFFAKSCLQRAMGQDLTAVDAWCYRHERFCGVNPRPLVESTAAASGKEPFCLHVAGFNCYDWSVMGARKGWFGKSLLPFTQWLAERLQFNCDDVILAENTPLFDMETLAQMTEHKWWLYVLHVSPKLLGEPVERKRVYIILLRKDRVRFVDGVLTEHVDCPAGSPQKVFDLTFERNVRMSAGDKFRASVEHVNHFIARQAADRKLPPTTRSGKTWSCYQAVTAAVRSKICEHKAAMERMSGKDLEDHTPEELKEWTADLTQHPDYMGPSQGCVPALLQRSNLWLFEKRRVALGLEHLEVQGWNLYGDADSASKVHRHLLAHLRLVKEHRLKSFAGNSMHMHVVGAVIAFLLGSLERVDSATDYI